MRRLTGFFKHSLLSEPHLWIAVLSAVAFFVMELLHLWHWPAWMDPLRGVVHMVIRRIEDAVLAQHSALCSRPRHPDEFDKLSGGFTGAYCAYNPSYRLEELSGDDYVISLLLQRFGVRCSPGRDTCSSPATRPGSTICSASVVRRVQAEWPHVSSVLQVKVIKERNAAPGAEMYIGTRDGKRVGIIEMTDFALGGSHGAPNDYLVTHDMNVIEHYLQKHFDDAWAAGVPFDLFEDDVALLPARTLPAAG
jgi:hypothetical protein